MDYERAFLRRPANGKPELVAESYVKKEILLVRIKRGVLVIRALSTERANISNGFLSIHGCVCSYVNSFKLKLRYEIVCEGISIICYMHINLLGKTSAEA
jgi:hypothetical protein